MVNLRNPQFKYRDCESRDPFLIKASIFLIIIEFEVENLNHAFQRPWLILNMSFSPYAQRTNYLILLKSITFLFH